MMPLTKTTTTQTLIDLFLLGLCLTLVYTLWLGAYPLLSPDEARYSEVAREMIVSGDYITPHLNGVIFLDKPILYYWLQASALKVFGIHEWSVRFWPSLVGVFGCLYTYITTLLIYNRRTAIFAALLLACSPLYFGLSHYANMDGEVAIFISCSLLSFLVAVKKENNQNFYFYLAYIFAALAILTKGLIGLAFPIMIIGLWILSLNRWRLLLQMRLVSGLCLLLILVLPWYILVQKANPDFFNYFFIKQQVSRFLTTQFIDHEPFWFYLLVVLLGFLPWSFFLFQTIFKKFKQVWYERQQHDADLFLLLWALVVLIFFSIPRSKTVGYIAPILPTLAILVASYFDQQLTLKSNKGLTVGLTIASALMTAVGVALLLKLHLVIKIFSPAAQKYFIYLGAAFLFFAAIILIHVSLKKVSYALGILVLVMLLSLTVGKRIAADVNFHSIKPLALIINRYIQPNDEVVTYYDYFYDLPLYTQRRITVTFNWDWPYVQFDNWSHEISNGKPTPISKEWLIDDATLKQRWVSNKRLFVVIDQSWLRQFQNLIGPYQILDEYQNVYLITNKPLPLPNTQSLLKTKVIMPKMINTQINART